MDLVELSRRLENLIRMGTIHSVDHPARRCRVQSGGLVTQWLPWLERRAGETATWSPPTVGEQCAILSPSGEPGGGIVFFGVPSDQIDTPSHTPDTHVIKFPDGAVFTYNHTTSHLEITGIATATIVASESITHDTPLTHITGQCIVENLLTYNNGIAGSGGTNGSHIQGELNHQGPLTHSGGSLTSNGVILHTHRHSGVQSGGSDTGGPA
ncbi:MAG: phage baseplate assembly protein V [Proteobacteria bacterium]|nr:phage baseplate assembly protein V [Pseudomonadota bacterium]